MGEIIHLNEANFDSTLQQLSGNVLIDFWAPWCGPCRALGKILETMASDNDSITVCKVDVDESPSIAERYEVSSIPMMLFFKDQELIDQTVGLMTERDILAKFN